MQRVIIHAWFPYLAAERVRRSARHAVGGMVADLPPNFLADLPMRAPLVLTSAYHGADLVDSVCRLAARHGLRSGMRLADARALCPDLVSRDSDVSADAADLLHLARWPRRRSGPPPAARSARRCEDCVPSRQAGGEGRPSGAPHRRHPATTRCHHVQQQP